MTKLTDNNRTIEIEMTTFENGNYSSDWSADFFDVGSLPYITDDNDDPVFLVRDVAYCIGQAEDWAHQTGDFCDDGEPSADCRCVVYNYL